MTDLLLFWHRRDLRLEDNQGLAMACDRSPQVVGVFCFDPQILQADDLAPARLAYLVGCLTALQQSYRARGGDLLFLWGDPTRQIADLARTLGATAVYWNQDGEPYARQRDQTVATALKTAGIEVQGDFWDQLLHPPGAIYSGSGQPYTVYTPFWRNWIKQAKAAPWPAPQGLTGLTSTQQAAATAAGRKAASMSS